MGKGERKQAEDDPFAMFAPAPNPGIVSVNTVKLSPPTQVPISKEAVLEIQKENVLKPQSVLSLDALEEQFQETENLKSCEVNQAEVKPSTPNGVTVSAVVLGKPEGQAKHKAVNFNNNFESVDKDYKNKWTQTLIAPTRNKKIMILSDFENDYSDVQVKEFTDASNKNTVQYVHKIPPAFGFDIELFYFEQCRYHHWNRDKGPSIAQLFKEMSGTLCKNGELRVVMISDKGWIRHAKSPLNSFTPIQEQKGYDSFRAFYDPDSKHLAPLEWFNKQKIKAIAKESDLLVSFQCYLGEHDEFIAFILKNTNG